MSIRLNKNIIYRLLLISLIITAVLLSTTFTIIQCRLSPLIAQFGGIVLSYLVCFVVFYFAINQGKKVQQNQKECFLILILSFLLTIVLFILIRNHVFTSIFTQSISVFLAEFVIWLVSYLLLFSKITEFQDQLHKASVTEVRDGLRNILARPIVYDLFQTVVGANSWRKNVIEKFVEKEQIVNDLILDIGCGTGDILSYIPRSVRYVGIDRNLKYINYAKKHFLHRNAIFLHQELKEDNLILNENKANVILAIGLIHHLDDTEFISLVRSVKNNLEPNGVFLTLDPVYYSEQSAIAKYIISKDRGKAVRTLEQYNSILIKEFSKVKYEINLAPLRIPYTGVIFVCRV